MCPKKSKYTCFSSSSCPYGLEWPRYGRGNRPITCISGASGVLRRLQRSALPRNSRRARSSIRVTHGSKHGSGRNSRARISLSSGNEMVSDSVHRCKPHRVIEVGKTHAALCFSARKDLAPEQDWRPYPHILTDVQCLMSSNGSANAMASTYSYATNPSGPTSRGRDGIKEATHCKSSVEMTPHEAGDGIHP